MHVGEFGEQLDVGADLGGDAGEFSQRLLALSQAHLRSAQCNLCPAALRLQRQCGLVLLECDRKIAPSGGRIRKPVMDGRRLWRKIESKLKVLFGLRVASLLQSTCQVVVDLPALGGSAKAARCATAAPGRSPEARKRFFKFICALVKWDLSEMAVRKSSIASLVIPVSRRQHAS